MDIHESCETLGLTIQDATPTTVRAAYKRLALQQHPDKNPGRETDATIAFQKLSLAYKTLNDHLEEEYYSPSSPIAPSSRESRRNDDDDDVVVPEWEEAKAVFREAFGVDFDDAVNVGVVVVKEIVSAASSLVENSGRRVSNECELREKEIRLKERRVGCLERDRRDAERRREEAVRRYDDFVNSFRDDIDFEKVSLKDALFSSVLSTSVLCHYVGFSYILSLFAMIVFFFVFKFLGELGSYMVAFEKRRKVFNDSVIEANHAVRIRSLELEVARRELDEAKSPFYVGMNIFGALLGFKDQQQDQNINDNNIAVASYFLV